MFRSGCLGAFVVVALLGAPYGVDGGGASTFIRATFGHVTDRLAAGIARPVGGTILGSVWNDQNEGIPNAQIRLRNLETGRIEATVKADAKGQFIFEGLEGGSYVLEYVNDQGKLLAVGHNFTVLPRETIATFIRLGTRPPWFAAFFGSAAAAAVSSAAALGLTAVAPAGQPSSPER